MQGLVPENHFSGHSNVSPEQKGKDLASILRAVQNDLVKVLGIKGVQEITVADAVAVASANASDLATLLTLSNEEKSVYNAIAALANDIKAKLDPVQEVEITSASAELVSDADASDLATAIALLNSLKAKYNASIALLNEMKSDLNAEGTVAIAAADAAAAASADASDQATAITLANELKTVLNGAVTLVNEVKTDLNAADKIELESRNLGF